ncbi:MULTISPECIES: acetyl-CoA carboxylase biotin carboxyl carrier protein [Anaerostipes]|uniref:acetyl-CoA carboxylase biotin carboxyl carrier protein n=1 Tax=Anaerostipes TaxID=207244 RepID=UPI000952348A|nr:MULTISPECIES: acetyl-CoA carboxylase biotin carboxyl carrier protein [Anaerostipes]OLR59909.1 acetyl-CoA carboxylase, biotin carboxyl carrier protein [Anaerostipes sp. 494a]
MKIEEMKELIQAVSEANVDEFEYENDDFSIRIAKNEAKVVTAEAIPAPAAAPAAVPAAPESDQNDTKIEGNEVKAPLVGTFYAAPSEGAEPFVSVGDTVKKGQVIGIVEAMKLMNEVESEFDGTVAAILVENGEMVEYGQPLVVIQ